MLEVIAGLNDDGLRRNYLNKIPLNRQIVEGWLAAAREYGLSLEPLTTGLSGPGGGEEQFRRLLDIGVRLNEGRGGAELPAADHERGGGADRRRARRAGPDGCGGRAARGGTDQPGAHVGAGAGRFSAPRPHGDCPRGDRPAARRVRAEGVAAAALHAGRRRAARAVLDPRRAAGGGGQAVRFRLHRAGRPFRPLPRTRSRPAVGVGQPGRGGGGERRTGRARWSGV